MLKNALYKSYRFFYLWETWWRRRFTTSGLFLFSIVILSAILGIDTTRNMIYQVFTFSLILLLISICWSLYFKIKCDINRDLPPFVTVKEPFRYRITIKNLTRSFQKDLSLFENSADPRPTKNELFNSREPGEELRNVWDRKTLYYRWLWIVRQNQKASFGENPIPDLPPGGTVSFDCELIPVNRGYLSFDSVTIARPDPLKLFMAFKRIPCQQKLLVLPQRYTIPHIALSGARKFHSGGVALASAIGNSDEFVSLRDFRPGDSIRNIHWKSWAKTGDLIVKEFQDEYFTRHALILDTYDDQTLSPLFEEAVSVASSFAGSLDNEDAILDLMFVGNQAYCFSMGRGLSSTEKLLEILACVKTETEKNINHLVPLLESFRSLLSGSICIFLKWDENRKQILETLKFTGSPVFAMLVTDNRAASEAILGDYLSQVHILESGNIQKDLMAL